MAPQANAHYQPNGGLSVTSRGGWLYTMLEGLHCATHVVPLTIRSTSNPPQPMYIRPGELNSVLKTTGLPYTVGQSNTAR